jgi:hypothetical protein
MTAQYTAVTALNIMHGLDHHTNWEILQPAWEAQDMGFIEFCCWVADIAGESTRMLEERDPQDWPGVYDYEVSHELGDDIALHVRSTGVLPKDEEWKYMLTVLTENFFAQGENTHETNP